MDSSEWETIWQIEAQGMDTLETDMKMVINNISNSSQLKGDDRSFSKWLSSTFYLGYAVPITTFYVGV